MVEAADGAPGDDGAGFDDVVVVGDGQGEVDILLDQQDCHVAAFTEGEDQVFDLEHDRRHAAFGWLVEQRLLPAAAQGSGHARAHRFEDGTDGHGV